MTTVEIEEGEYLKSGDTKPDLVVQLRKDNGAPKSLDNHDVRVFIKEESGDDLVVDDDLDGNVSVEDEDNGTISYSWQDGDTDKVATYVGEIEIEELDDSDDPSGKITTFPSRGYFEIRVQEGLN